MIPCPPATISQQSFRHRVQEGPWRATILRLLRKRREEETKGFEHYPSAVEKVSLNRNHNSAVSCDVAQLFFFFFFCSSHNESSMIMPCFSCLCTAHASYHQPCSPLRVLYQTGKFCVILTALNEIVYDVFFMCSEVKLAVIALQSMYKTCDEKVSMYKTSYKKKDTCISLLNMENKNLI